MRERRRIEKTVLPNGVTVLTEEIPHAYSVAAGVFIKVGSRHELPSQEGISHFLEHMVFKGTEKRDALTVAREMDALGGSVDAFTSKEYTCYYFKVLPHNVKKAIELISDLILHPLLNEEDVEKEKEVVIQEILSVEDTPEEYVQEIMFRHFFNEHPLSKFLLGTVESVNGFTKKSLLEFMNSHYRSENVLVGVAGNIEHNELVGLVWKHFKGFRPGYSQNGFHPVPFNPDNIVILKKPLEQVHICIGMQGAGYGDKERYFLSLFSTIFGTSNSSRLFQEIREKRGWAYDVYSFTHSYGDTGVFGIYLATKRENVRDVLKVIVDELVEVRNGGIDEKELEIAKEHLISSFLISSENTDASMLRLCKNYIYTNKLVSCEEVVENIKNVSEMDLKRVAEKLLHPCRFTVVVMGDVDERLVPDFLNPWRNI